MPAFAWCLVLLLMGGGAYVAADHAEVRVREALALKCARESIGTDSAICDCYTSRDLPIPEDMK
jgi:hypothetical protein